jgi:hypothetical protein
MAKKAAYSEPEAEPEAGPVSLTGPLTVGVPATIGIEADPDTDVTVTVAAAVGGASETVLRTDENGHAEMTLVPQTVGTVDVAVTTTTVTVIGSATGDVSGSPPTVPLSLTGIDPTSSEVGPPDRLTLVAEGDGFDLGTRMSFGVFSKEEADAGLGVEGEPKWEAGTRYIDGQHVSLDLTAGLFPGEDPAVPVSVGQPDGTTAGPVSFAFTAPAETEPAVIPWGSAET